MTIEIERFSNGIADSHGQCSGIGRLIEQFLNDGKFVAAQTRNQIDISDTTAAADWPRP